MDGNGALFGSTKGTAREVLAQFSVDLPRKHGRGGQSALRFDRLRLEKRRNYVRRIAELSTRLFISNDHPSVKGVVLAGSGNFKDELAKSGLFDKRLRSIVVSSVDVAHGGETGFDQAVALSAEAIGSAALLREKRLLERFMSEIELDSGRYCFSVEDTLQALEMGAVETLLVWEDLAVNRCEIRDPTTGGKTVAHHPKKREGRKAPGDGGDYEVIKEECLVAWIGDNYKKFGCSLELITDRSGLGKQFVMGFGGFGAILRWQVDFSHMSSGREEESHVQGFDRSDEASEGTGEMGHDDDYQFDDREFGF